jgi:hypothetical protein
MNVTSKPPAKAGGNSRVSSNVNRLIRFEIPRFIMYVVPEKPLAEAGGNSRVSSNVNGLIRVKIPRFIMHVVPELREIILKSFNQVIQG